MRSYNLTDWKKYVDERKTNSNIDKFEFAKKLNVRPVVVERMNTDYNKIAKTIKEN